MWHIFVKFTSYTKDKIKIITPTPELLRFQHKELFPFHALNTCQTDFLLTDVWCQYHTALCLLSNLYIKLSLYEIT